MNTSKLISAGAVIAVLFLAGCGSSGGLGDILGGGSPSNATGEIRGTVDIVETSSRSILLRNVDTGSMLSSGGSGSGAVRVYYDERTPVEYQGRTYRPENLEPGDEVAVRVSQSGNQLFAESMTVLRNAGGTTGTSTSPTSGTVRGTIRYTDTSRRTIEIDRSGYNQTMTFEYDTRTPVTFSGRSYRPEDLERGDEIEIRYRDIGSGRSLAEEINVIRSVSSSTSPGTSQSVLRGTVSSIDTGRRLIELEQTRWMSGFIGGGTSTGRVVVQYGTNTQVEHQGSYHPVTNLERGDIVEVEVQNSTSSTPFANRIYLVQDVRR